MKNNNSKFKNIILQKKLLCRNLFVSKYFCFVCHEMWLRKHNCSAFVFVFHLNCHFYGPNKMWIEVKHEKYNAKKWTRTKQRIIENRGKSEFGELLLNIFVFSLLAIIAKPINWVCVKRGKYTHGHHTNTQQISVVNVLPSIIYASKFIQWDSTNT